LQYSGKRRRKVIKSTIFQYFMERLYHPLNCSVFPFQIHITCILYCDHSTKRLKHCFSVSHICFANLCMAELPWLYYRYTVCMHVLYRDTSTKFSNSFFFMTRSQQVPGGHPKSNYIEFADIIESKGYSPLLFKMRGPGTQRRIIFCVLCSTAQET
jgi:hypothetical protein